MENGVTGWNKRFLEKHNRFLNNESVNSFNMRLRYFYIEQIKKING